ncbi:hypothetical protein ZIOFF_035280 [Zingiber officinale]|uniref:IBB domain-containing protein n=1 Tax=Zingiber officinale TaxID=94328 RepID=A0A8J5L7H2_ZINOF|nr:hypothetical protein ZIOFF_035280 [Zingiber officinale]
MVARGLFSHPQAIIIPATAMDNKKSKKSTEAVSNDNSMQLEAVMNFHKLLSIERSPPIEEVVQSRVVPQFVEFLMREDYPQLQFEDAWALTNIASGTSESTKVFGNVAGDSPICRDLVLANGALFPLGKPQPDFNQVTSALPALERLIHSNDEELQTDACWANIASGTSESTKVFGNVAGDSPICRDLVLANGALFPLGKPQPNFNQVTSALPALERLIHSNDEELQTDACWALSYLSNVCYQSSSASLSPQPLDSESQKKVSRRKLVASYQISQLNKEQIQVVKAAGVTSPLVNIMQIAEIEVREEREAKVQQWPIDFIDIHHPILEILGVDSLFHSNCKIPIKAPELKVLSPMVLKVRPLRYCHLHLSACFHASWFVATLAAPDLIPLNTAPLAHKICATFVLYRSS